VDPLPHELLSIVKQRINLTRPLSSENFDRSANSVAASKSAKDRNQRTEESHVSTITVKDGNAIYYKDWGTGQPIVFSHGWPLTADAWDAQMFFFGQRGYRVIAHDRRGNGRSSQPWEGNEMNTFADDLATLIEALDLKDAVLIGHSTVQSAYRRLSSSERFPR
jgi:hypothetical protein